MTALTASLVLVACGGDDEDTATSTPAATGSASSVDQLLGKISPASGTPVKIGVISDGKGPVSDLSFEGPVADTTVAYLNERKSGIGGHPIELVKCDALADPGKGTDCANQMVEENVNAVVVGSSSVVESIWKPLHDAKIPVVFGFSTQASVLADGESTFVLYDSMFTLNLPIELAKENKLDSVSVVVINVPTAMSSFEKVAPAIYKAAGIELNVVPIAPGTADMTPEMQRIAADGPSVVQIIGSDSFCIAALNGLKTVGFTGPITAVAQCITDATRKSVPGATLKGITVGATAPVGTDNPSTKLFAAVVDTYGKGKNIDVNRQGSLSMFTVVAGLQAATEGITGDITPASIAAAMRSMQEKPLPGADPLKFRCGGKARPATPATCVRGGLVTTLDDKGQPTGYRAVGNTSIED